MAKPAPITAVRGFPDVLPEDSQRWQALEDAARALFSVYGFGEIRLPIVERTELFARSVGEYGSVVFISGNMPYKTEIAPILIVARLEEFAYGEATAIAVVLLVASLGMLAVINFLERWSKTNVA